jgi:nucleoside-diphosphate-sugar epimerase
MHGRSTTMKTIAITSASSNLGKQLIPLLKDKGYTVWAITRKPLRSCADLNITDWLENPEAHTKIQRADVVIHLAGEIFGRQWNDFYQPNIKTTEIVAANIGKQRDQKVIFLSYPGADRNSSNMFLRAKGTAEHLLMQSQAEVTIFRFQFAVNPAQPSGFEEYLTYNGKEAVRIVGNGKQSLSTILQRDVLKFILAAIELNHNGIYYLRPCSQGNCGAGTNI